MKQKERPPASLMKQKIRPKAISLLPHDMKQWQYGYNSVDKARPYINEIVKIYLDTYHKDDIRKLNELLDEQVDISKELYGEGSNYKQYKKTKLDDLKKRMGNAVLAEMREFAKMEREDNYFAGSRRKLRKRRLDLDRIRRQRRLQHERIRSEKELLDH